VTARRIAIAICLIAGTALAIVAPKFGAVGTYSGGAGKERGVTYQFINKPSGHLIHNRSGIVVCDIGPDSPSRSTCIASKGKVGAYVARLAPGHYQKIAYLAGEARHLCHANRPSGPNIIDVTITSGQTITVDWYCQVFPPKKHHHHRAPSTSTAPPTQTAPPTGTPASPTASPPGPTP
jgi:hypothetical protein